MSDRYGSYPPDEPVIGAPPPPKPPQPDRFSEPIIGVEEPEYGYEEEWEEDYAGDDGFEPGYPYEDDEYYADEPTRQPMFYLFIVLAIIVGAGSVFFLFSVMGDDQMEQAPTPIPPPIRINAEIVEPASGERVNVGDRVEVRLQASASEDITAFQLFVQDRPGPQVAAPAPDGAGIYQVVIPFDIDERAEYSVFIRVTTASGATRDTARIQLSAVEGIGTARPTAIRGRITTQVSLRTRPADNAEVLATLNPGRDIEIQGRTSDNEWLFVDLNGGGWIKRAAVELFDSVQLIPVRQATPTPAPPTATPEPVPSPSPSPTPTPEHAPDFVPHDAELIDGGRVLRITVVNAAPNAYEGSLVVAVSGVPATPAEKAFGVSLAANGGSARLDFALDPPVRERSAVEVRVDPANAIRETDENNNNATFQLSPPLELPQLVIAGTLVQGNDVFVRIENQGGDIAATGTLTISLTTGATTSTTSATAALDIPRGGSQTVVLTRPAGTGVATVQVIVGGDVLAEDTVLIEP